MGAGRNTRVQLQLLCFHQHHNFSLTLRIEQINYPTVDAQQQILGDLGATKSTALLMLETEFFISCRHGFKITTIRAGDKRAII